jgi:hypothetical protein
MPSLSPSCARPWGDVDNDDDNPIDLDAEDPEYLWDIHVGLKPSPLDVAMLDVAMLDAETDNEGEIEDDLPYGAEKEVNSMMVNMMVKLGDCNNHDMEWLPVKERTKVEARKKGMLAPRM